MSKSGTRKANPRRRKPARIIRDRELLIVQPASCATDLAPLQTRRQVALADPATGVRIASRAELLFEYSSMLGSSLELPVAMLPDVATALTQAGHPAEPYQRYGEVL